jgi:hypothetical protein
MTENPAGKLVDAAKLIFEQIREALERSSPDQFVSIEPISGEHFLGPTLSEAIQAARGRYPNRLVHTFRVGHGAAVHFGQVGR